jgi:hypothetical protein
MPIVAFRNLLLPTIALSPHKVNSSLAKQFGLMSGSGSMAQASAEPAIRWDEDSAITEISLAATKTFRTPTDFGRIPCVGTPRRFRRSVVFELCGGRMPRYFLHQRRKAGLIRDPEGSELPGVVAACAEAIESARELMSEAILEGWDISGRSFEVTDESDQTVLVVWFRDAYSPAD